jgi:ankyrin repeat protein
MLNAWHPCSAYMRHAPRMCQPTPPHASQQVVDSVSKACAYGDFDKLKQFIVEDPSCVNASDESGYYPLQWAALNNRIVEVNYLLSEGASINATDGTGQTALHWAAVRGSLPVVEALLRAHSDHELRDNRGYTLTHVAAQYGQTAVLYHVVGAVCCSHAWLRSRHAICMGQLRMAGRHLPPLRCAGAQVERGHRHARQRRPHAAALGRVQGLP